MLKKLPILMSSMIIAIILFQSALIAPAINQLINVEEAAIFLRFIWPKFFIVIGVLSMLSIVSLFALKNRSTKIKSFMISSLILMLGCYLVTPLINNAKDVGNDQLWTILHMSTVAATLVVLILNFLCVLKWKAIK